MFNLQTSWRYELDHQMWWSSCCNWAAFLPDRLLLHGLVHQRKRQTLRFECAKLATADATVHRYGNLDR